MEMESLVNLEVGIVGMGLIGGSIVRALRKKTDIRIIRVVDTDLPSMEKAYKDGMVTSYSLDLMSLKGCDLIYLCVPVGILPSILDHLSSWYTGIVTDVSSTKDRIVNYAGIHHPGLRFIGGHPMAGSEKVGYAASNENLFENAPYILCPYTGAEDTSESIQSIQSIHSIDSANSINSSDETAKELTRDPDMSLIWNLAVRMCAVPLVMSPKDHDTAVGLISHLPHIVAYSLVHSVQSKKDDRLKIIAAGGFRDITRIASSDPALWTDILCDSADTITTLLEEYIAFLELMKEKLLQNDKDKLFALFSEAKEYRDRLPVATNTRSSSIQLWVEVDDKPGMIGKIAVLFGNHGINIKNMNIQDNRAYEGGSLRITLSSARDARNGADLLEKENLTVRIIE